MIGVRSLALAGARPLIIRAIGCYVTEFPPPINFETIVSKDNNRQIINRIKCEGRRDRRRNGPAKHATKSRRVRIDGG